jgi:hypothetical protein
MVKNSEKIGQNPMMRSFSDLTKGFGPERRKRIEQRKAEIQQDLVECPEMFALVYPSWLEPDEDE